MAARLTGNVAGVRVPSHVYVAHNVFDLRFFYREIQEPGLRSQMPKKSRQETRRLPNNDIAKEKRYWI